MITFVTANKIIHSFKNSTNMEEKLKKGQTSFKNLTSKTWEKWCELCLSPKTEMAEQIALIAIIVLCSVMVLFASIWNASIMGCAMGLVFTFYSSRTLVMVWNEYKKERK